MFKIGHIHSMLNCFTLADCTLEMLDTAPQRANYLFTGFRKPRDGFQISSLSEAIFLNKMSMIKIFSNVLMIDCI